MGFTTQESNQKLIASIMLKKEGVVTEPSFWKRTKNAITGKREPTEMLGTVVSGKFKSIGSKTIGEGDNAMELIEIELEDENGAYVISTARTQVSRNIVNSLAGTCQEFKLENISIGLYEKAGNDGKLYPRVWVKNNDTQTAWKFSIDEQNGLKAETTFKGKKMIDWTNFETVLRDSFNEINGVSVAEDEVFGEEPVAKEVTKVTEKKPITKKEALEDDLPF